jgi:lysophospholipase L1-like esterase
MKKAVIYSLSVFLFTGSMLPFGAAIKTNTMTTINDTAVITWLALGDSYTIGESVPAHDRYPVQTTELLKAEGIQVADPEIIAVTGWTTQNLWNAVKDKPLTPTFNIVSLLIGVNNQYQGRSLEEYKQQFTILLQRAIQLAGNKAGHVFVLSIPDYSITPFAVHSDKTKIAAAIDSFNNANKEISLALHARYLDITAASRKAAADPSLITEDGLHFSGKEYHAWSSMLAPLIKSALQ